MKKNMCLIIGIAILLIGMSITPSTGINLVKQSTKTTLDGNTLYVGCLGPGCYSKIQDAIDDASDGDTVFVYDDSSPYIENIIINKTINLIGENRDTTVIDGNGSEDVIHLDTDGVYISGFTLQNDGGNWDNAGIEILTNNNTIIDNVITNNFYGIYLRGSCSNKIINNIVNSCKYFVLYANRFCSNNLIQNNTFSDNLGVFFLSDSYDNVFTGNIFSNSSFGLSLYSYRNKVIDNSFLKSGLDVVTFHNIIKNNTVNGKPLFFLEDKSNIIIDDDNGQVILINCSYITIKNQNLFNTSYPIHLRYSNNCSILNNNAYNSEYGIFLDCSDYNIIANNSVKSNVCNGIELSCSSNNIIKDNICSENGGNVHYYGIRLYQSSNNVIIHNRCFQNGVGIACMTYSDNNIIEGNRIYNNRIHGIILKLSSNDNVIISNDITNNYRCIWFESVAFNKITNNNFLNNKNDILLNIVYYHQLRLFGALYINGNYWGKARILPKFIPGEYTWVLLEAPYGGFSIYFHWIYIDWNPAKEPYDIT